MGVRLYSRSRESKRSFQFFKPAITSLNVNLSQYTVKVNLPKLDAKWVIIADFWRHLETHHWVIFDRRLRMSHGRPAQMVCEKERLSRTKYISHDSAKSQNQSASRSIEIELGHAENNFLKTPLTNLYRKNVHIWWTRHIYIRFKCKFCMCKRYHQTKKYLSQYFSRIWPIYIFPGVFPRNIGTTCTTDACSD